jgi:hypothetical protein
LLINRFAVVSTFSPLVSVGPQILDWSLGAYWVKDHELRNAGASCRHQHLRPPAIEGRQLPAPKIRAPVDSFLNSFADDSAMALPTLPAASFGDGNDGDIVGV